MNFSVTRNGKKLSKELYTWDEKTKTFSTTEADLVLDFLNINGVTFKTSAGCIFQTGANCSFNTGSYCTFKTGSHCTFDTGSNCTFDTGKNCVVVRRGVFEVILLKENQIIKLNDFYSKGFTIISPTKTITIDNKNIEISLESFEQLKQQLID